jgi:4-hydroxybutyryl-CoA dehydratase/vinylacetyl-CoA-Delta-isomerase
MTSSISFLTSFITSSLAVGYRTESMHGAGSPQAQRIMISRQRNLEQKKKLAKKIAGIKD